MSSSTELPNTQDRALFWLFLAAFFTLVIWNIPMGRQILFPFTVLATWFHEMGHGIAALMVGGNFHKLEIFSNASGLAYISMAQGATYPLKSAFSSAGGLLGPPVVGAMLILAGRNVRTANWAFGILSLSMFLSVIFLVRTVFGVAAIGSMATLFLLLAWKASAGVKQVAVQFLGVQACLATYVQLDYLFTHKVVVGGQERLSDTGSIAEHLLLPYWFWGGALAFVSSLILILSLRLAYRN